MDLPNTQLFVPSGARVYGNYDPAALNASFTAIAAAFNPAWSVITTDTQLTATLRSVVADTSGVAANSKIVVTLPANPSIGDPPCFVSIRASGIANPSNCIVTTSDGTNINSIAQLASPYLQSPALWAGSDFLHFTFVGGIIGWLAEGELGAVPTTAPFAFGAMPWQGQSLVVTNSATYAVEALQVEGVSATVIRNAASATINLGDSTSTFNGNAGPYALPTDLKAYKVTCIGVRAFEVTQ
jgi:hypothetical protein